MTVMKKNILSPHKRRLALTFCLGSGSFLVVGYALYFIADILSPAWAQQLIEVLKPVLGALEKAEIVSKKPLAAQVVIAYCAFGFFAYVAWFSCWFLLIKEWRILLQQGMIKTYSRSKMLLHGLGMIFLFSFLYPWFFFHTHGSTSLSWRDSAMLSPNLISMSMLLIGAWIAAIATPFGLLTIWTAVVGARETGSR